MNQKRVGLDIKAGHLQINSSDVVAKSILDKIPSRVSNDGAVVSLSTKFEQSMSLGSQPDRIFIVVEFTSHMMATKMDIINWLSEAGVERANLEIYNIDDSLLEKMNNADNTTARKKILQNMNRYTH